MVSCFISRFAPVSASSKTSSDAPSVVCMHMYVCVRVCVCGYTCMYICIRACVPSACGYTYMYLHEWGTCFCVYVRESVYVIMPYDCMGDCVYASVL